MIEMTKMHIGFDDTDSPRMGCTTYVAALLIDKLLRKGVVFTDYPNLIRLNPNVPWKTRGNGALCLRIECEEGIVEEVMETVVDTVEKNSDLEYQGTEPGIVFFFNTIPLELKVFAKKTIQGIVKMKDTLRLVEKFGAEAVGFKNGRGIIGSLAAIGETLEEDHTYEIIAYRTPENRGTKRKVEAPSVKEMDEEILQLTFNNIDPETKRILITPRGPDPILYGVRGETAEAVRKAHKMIRSLEPVERWMIFRTNHGTDAHLRGINSIKEIEPFNPAIVQGAVSKEPKIIPVRHVVFSIKDKTGEVDCAAYEPTGSLRQIAKQLILGDIVEAYGGIRAASSEHPLTVNLEKMRVLELKPIFVLFNPKCPKCSKTMKSMGKNKGFKCDRCGFRDSKAKKVAVESERNIKTGLYITPPRSQRHLTKPHCRYGKEKFGKPQKMIADWHYP
jgi:tRNA(Ile2)-agmatinylcytidine synthase